MLHFKALRAGKEYLMAAPERRERRTDEIPPQHRRRRADDGRQDPQAEPATARRRIGGAMRRMRQPLIGLGLAGLAFPLVRATSGPESSAPQPDDGALAYAAAPGGEMEAADAALDTEDSLASRIAETREDAERNNHVERAVDRYGISRDLAEDIFDAARAANIEPRLAYGLVKTESTFNERAVSPVGARGLTQVMPRTAAWLVPGTRTQDLFDRQTNLKLGFTYLDQMIAKYKGNVRLALLAYNRGPGTVDKVLKKGGNPDNGYADKVLRG
jgi:soluble lytic murein transglycosylase-like protein